MKIGNLELVYNYLGFNLIIKLEEPRRLCELTKWLSYISPDGVYIIELYLRMFDKNTLTPLE